MPRLAVIFDANAYIGISNRDMDEVILRGRSNSVVSWASYFVVEELIARTADPDPRRAGGGVWALKRLAEHCAMYDGFVERVDFLADPRYQVAEFVFRRSLPRVPQKVIDTYGTIVKTIADDPTRERWPQWVRESAGALRREILVAEDSFAQSILNDAAQGVLPRAETWADVRAKPEAAAALAAGIASQQGLELCAGMFAATLGDLVPGGVSEDEIATAASILKDSFPLPLRIFNALLYRVVKDALDASQPHVANTLWDLQLAFSVPKSREISNMPLWIVTGDAIFHRAAEEAGAQHLVHSLRDYIELVRRPEELRAVIDRFGTAATG